MIWKNSHGVKGAKQLPDLTLELASEPWSEEHAAYNFAGVASLLAWLT